MTFQVDNVYNHFVEKFWNKYPFFSFLYYSDDQVNAHLYSSQEKKFVIVAIKQMNSDAFTVTQLGLDIPNTIYTPDFNSLCKSLEDRYKLYCKKGDAICSTCQVWYKENSGIPICKCPHWTKYPNECYCTPSIQK